MTPRFCHHCRTTLTPGARFCPNCGVAVAELRPGAASSQPSVPSPTQPASPPALPADQGSSRVGIALFLAAVFTAVVIAFGAGIIDIRSSDPYAGLDAIAFADLPSDWVISRTGGALVISSHEGDQQAEVPAGRRITVRAIDIRAKSSPKVSDGLGNYPDSRVRRILRIEEAPSVVSVGGFEGSAIGYVEDRLGAELFVRHVAVEPGGDYAYFIIQEVLVKEDPAAGTDLASVRAGFDEMLRTARFSE